MPLETLLAKLDSFAVGREMHSFASLLYPWCRSITGDGFRDTLYAVIKRIPIELHEVPSGTQVFDWTIPDEWNIRDAFIKNDHGERVVDFRNHNLHVVNYSVPVDRRMSLAELRLHLHSIPEKPDWIPYRTTYYKKAWGFCLSHRQLTALPNGEYHVVIDSTLKPGHLTYGELFLPGQMEDEVLISVHCCHPSLANDNLSGIVVATRLAQELRRIDLRYSYRFLFVPGTIGSITWLSRNEKIATRIAHGLVLTCLGDPGGFTYKKSRRGDAEIDRAAAQVLRWSKEPHRIVDFVPYGYDERQYCSPGFNLPIGCFMRSPHGEFPEYHTSGDDLDFVQPEALGDSLVKLLQIIDVLEGNYRYVSLNPKGEPQLGRRGLYGAIGEQVMAMLWTLNLADGSHSLLDIAERSNIPFSTLKTAASKLREQQLVATIA
ncbi:MAG TPA: DUF4910 domain-containing protein [Chthoniobacterales bacterium]